MASVHGGFCLLRERGCAGLGNRLRAAEKQKNKNEEKNKKSVDIFPFISYTVKVASE